MAKLSSNDAQFIRNVFKRERQSAELAISNKELARNSVGGGLFGSAIDSSVNGVMGDILSLDRRMLYRYRDYEEMDEYGDISSALDIYSDDATQIDGVTGKSVWVETDDGKVKDELTDLFDKRLRIEEKIWEITRTLCK
jgi:hypothetical protein